MRLAFFITLLVARAAAADPPDLMNVARTHYEAGRALYQLGKYDQALVEFNEGYRLAPRPSFLLNLAQCYRQLGRLDEARAHYEKFLAAAPIDDPMRSDVKQILTTLRPAPVAASVPAVIAPAPVVEVKRRGWHRDPAGGVLLASGVVAVVAGAVLLGLSSHRLSHANDSYGDFVAAQSAPDQRIGGAAMLSAGVALGVGAAIRYGTVK
jgi:tetratricopeptide (TPR) repeat protein